MSIESESGDDGVGTEDSDGSSRDDLGDAIVELEHLLKKDKDADESKLFGVGDATSAPALTEAGGLSPHAGTLRGDQSQASAEKIHFKTLEPGSAD